MKIISSYLALLHIYPFSSALPVFDGSSNPRSFVRKIHQPAQIDELSLDTTQFVYMNHHLNEPQSEEQVVGMPRMTTRNLVFDNRELIYYGGPVIGKVKVITIWWGSGVKYTSELENFYAGITDSKWMRIMSEYSTSSTIIGMGSWMKSYNYTTAPQTSSGYSEMLSDSDIQSNLLMLIDSGYVPPPDKNTFYAIHLAPKINITVTHKQFSCSGFCAYHFTMAYPETNISTIPVINYGVISDLDDPRDTNTNTFKRLCSISSHVLAGVITNPIVGMDKSNAFPSGWLNTDGKETPDICTSTQGTTMGADGASYSVQTIWSNKAGACIANVPNLDWTVTSAIAISALNVVESGTLGLAFAVVTTFLSLVILSGLVWANKKKGTTTASFDVKRLTKGLEEDDDVKTVSQVDYYEGDEDASTVVVSNKGTYRF